MFNDEKLLFFIGIVSPLSAAEADT